MRLLMWVLVIVIVLWAIFSKKKAVREEARSGTPEERRGSAGAERMLQCAHCGVHVPASETVVDSAGAVFCCNEHRLEHVRS